MAMDAYKKGQFPSIRAAALMYRVNPNTLRCRLNGRQPRDAILANGRSLDNDEEQTLTKQILDLASRGYPPRKQIVEDTANMLRRLRGKKPVGKNWVNNYVSRTPEVQLIQSKKYNYQRAKQEDPQVISEHF